MNKITRFVVAFASGLICTLPVTGFIYGFASCTGCAGDFSGFLGRIFIGFIHAFLNITTLGTPWDNEGGTSYTNLRCYSLLAFVIITVLVYFAIDLIQSKKRGN